MMGTARLPPQEALLEQSRTVLAWLKGLPAGSFERPTVLANWDLRQLAGHLVLIHSSFTTSIDQPTKHAAVPVHEFVTRYRRDVEMIMESTLQASGGLSGRQVVERLESAIDDLATRLDAGVRMAQVIITRRGPTTIEDYLATRIVELVVHTDDLNRSVPEMTPATLQRSALARCARTLGRRRLGRSRYARSRMRPAARTRPSECSVTAGTGGTSPTNVLSNLRSDQELAGAIDRAVERWMDRRIDGHIEEEVCIPQGLPYLTCFVCMNEAPLELGT